jgi:hypothetical protein
MTKGACTMRANTFNTRVAGTIFAVGIVIVLGAMVSKAEPSSEPVGIKGDRLAVVEHKSECPQIMWPYGCDWQGTTSVSQTKRNIR